MRHCGKREHSLDLHAEELQESCEDAHLIKKENIVSRPVEDIRLCVTFIKDTFTQRERDLSFQTVKYSQ